jgi:hypothetical protein
VVSNRSGMRRIAKNVKPIKLVSIKGDSTNLAFKFTVARAKTAVRKKASPLYTNNKIVIVFASSELETLHE